MKEDEKERIDKLEKCVKEKDERLKKQSRRIEKIENRYSTIIWIFIISFIVVGFILLGFTMFHIHGNLPDAITSTDGGANGSLSGKTLNFVDPLQFVGFPIICFLAFVGFLTVLYIAHGLIKDRIEANDRYRERYG